MNGLNGWGVFEWEYGIQAYLWESWMVKTRQSQSYISNLKEYIKFAHLPSDLLETGFGERASARAPPHPPRAR